MTSRLRNSRFILSAGLCLWLCLSTGPARAVEIVDRIVANVNGEIITLREINARQKNFMKSLSSKDVPNETELRRSILKHLIDQILVLQEAKRLKIQITDDEVNQAIERIRTENKASQAQMVADLAKSGITLEMYKKELKVDLTKNRLIGSQFGIHIVVTEEEIDTAIQEGGLDRLSGDKDFSRTDDTKSDVRGRIQARNIFLGLPAEPTPEIVKAKTAQAEKIIVEIKGGLDFAAAASKYSEAPNAKQGGDLGLISLSDLDSQIRNAVKGLKPGEISQPITTPKGILIFQVVKGIEESTDKKKAEGKKPSEKEKVEKKTVGSPEERQKVRQALMQRKLEAKVEEWLIGLRTKAMIKVDL